MSRSQTARKVVDMEARRGPGRKGGAGRGGFLSSDERREAVGFIIMAVSLIVFLSLALNPAEVRGITSSETPSAAGQIGKTIAVIMGMGFGLGSFVLPLAFGVWGWMIFWKRPVRAIVTKGIGITLGLIAVCAFLGRAFGDSYLGGALGDRTAADLEYYFGVVSYIVIFLLAVLAIVVATPLSFTAVFEGISRGCVLGFGYVTTGWLWLAGEIQKRRLEERAPRRSHRRARLVEEMEEEFEENEEFTEDEESSAPARHHAFHETRMRIVKGEPIGQVEMPDTGLLDPREASPGAETIETETAPELPPASPGETIHDLSEEEEEEEREEDIEGTYADEEEEEEEIEYTLPPIDCLDLPSEEKVISEEDLKAKGEVLKDTLQDFNVECRVGDITPGPTVTRYEIVPAPGIKVSAIRNLEDDIALTLAAPSIRMEAPIPGKAAIGIEIPNAKKSIVLLRDVIESDEFRAMRRISPLAVALGKDIAGRPVVADLREMPHLLIAGATGAGKSVCINALINSILVSATPKEVKLLLIDPKVVELQDYNGVPHLLAPVVTDVRKATKVLEWGVEEMARRYQILARSGVRDIEGYNALMGDDSEVARLVDDDPLPPHMPYLVLVVDEFSDLMQVAGKECEELIIRLAQMARAVGIHLVIATQRPSVDVITGVIKANLPSRIAFQVASRVDSRTILDAQGAERLLGKGDMLFKPGNRPKATRVQGSFISLGEIRRVKSHYQAQAETKYRLKIVADTDPFMSAEGPETDQVEDPLFSEACRIVLEDGHASVSRLQRRLKVGHARAGRIVDLMESKGLVGPPDGSKPREIFFDESYLEELEEKHPVN